MNPAEELVQCQNIVYKGFSSVDESGIDWLNEFCKDFHKFCSKLHKFLIFDCNQKTLVIETCFLCISQVVCCVKYLEKTIKIEGNEGIVMSSSRQYFLDRILWCFARLKSTVNTARDDVIVCNAEDSNFVASMDTLIELIEPYSAYNKKELSNVAKFNAQALFDSQKIRTTVDLLLGQTLAFANVTLDCDKTGLTAICQKVLRECIAFENTCSLEKGKLTHDEHQRQFKATIFENCLYQLEDYVNESLLRLVYQVLVDSTQDSVENLRQLVNTNAGDELDIRIADFDGNVDRILQIGLFAMALSVDVKAKTTVRSCLASLESLDSALIPSLYTKDDFHSTILEEHYLSEIQKFKNAIQSIVDTTAFCKCYEEMLYDCIQESQKEFNKNSIIAILAKGKVLDEHFQINADDLFLKNNIYGHTMNESYEKFNLMLNECLACLACVDQIDNSRMLKRLKIFRCTVQKLIENVDKKSQEEVIVGASILDKSSTKKNKTAEKDISLEGYGITPSVTCILYKSKRRKNNSDSLKATTSKLKIFEGCSFELDNNRSATCNTKSPKLKRRVSLRTKMFKRQKSNDAPTINPMYNDHSTNLHITDILEQITNLSSTFTKNNSTVH